MVLLILMRYKHDDVVCVWCKVGFDLHEKHAGFYGFLDRIRYQFNITV